MRFKELMRQDAKEFEELMDEKRRKKEEKDNWKEATKWAKEMERVDGSNVQLTLPRSRTKTNSSL